METNAAAPTIGVLALQGAFREHIAVLRRLGATTREARLPEDLDGLDGLIIPGGESTVIGKLMVKYGVDDAIRAFAARGGALWGSCAGMILLAREVGREQPLLGLLDIDVQRNAYGSQLFSFEQTLDLPNLDIVDHRAVFIRAPVVTRVGPGVTVEARDAAGRIVAVSAADGRLFATAFHPELTGDTRLHARFCAVAATREPAFAGARAGDG